MCWVYLEWWLVVYVSWGNIFGFRWGIRLGCVNLIVIMGGLILILCILGLGCMSY